MKDQFKYNAPAAPAPVRIEQVFAEKPGGGLLAEVDYDVLQSTAVGYDSSAKRWKPIKSARIITKTTASGTSIEVEKGSGFKQGEFIGYGNVAIAISTITTTDPNKDTITVASGFEDAIEAGECLYQAKAAADGDSASAEPIYAPEYIVDDGHYCANNGVVAPAGMGDVPVRLINGANVRKETACFGKDIEALLPSIKRV